MVSRNSRREKFSNIVWLIAIAFVLSLALVLRISHNNITEIAKDGTDSATYHYAAINIHKYGFITWDRDGAMARGEVEAVPSQVLAVGYPLFLAFLYIFFPATYQTVFIVNVILSMITLLLILLLLQEMAVSKPATLFVLTVASIYPAFVYMISSALTENLFIPLILAAVLCYIRYWKDSHPLFLVAGNLLFTYASTVRAQAFLLLLLCVIADIARKPRKSFGCILYSLANVCGSVLVLYVPIWVWLLLTTGHFVLYPSAGQGPQIWGAMPYFIDMDWSTGKTLSEVSSANFAAAPGVYLKWRLFGFFQRMWYDIWDENLVHPYPELRPFLLVQQLIIVPTLVLIPIFSKQYSGKHYFVASIPIIITLSCMSLHGLPHYVIVSLPFVMILSGMHLDIIICLVSHRGQTTLLGPTIFRHFYLIVHKLFFAVTSLFSVILIYSVYVFSYQIAQEQSQYRLSKYADLSIRDLTSRECISEISFTEKDIDANVIFYNIEKQADGRFRGSEQATNIIEVTIPQDAVYTEQNIITKVSLDLPGGYPFDMMTVYWTGANTPEYSESKVYSFPKAGWERSNVIEIYIDDDVTSLQIVPAVFRGGTISFNQISIQKYER